MTFERRTNTDTTLCHSVWGIRIPGGGSNSTSTTTCQQLLGTALIGAADPPATSEAAQDAPCPSLHRPLTDVTPPCHRLPLFMRRTSNPEKKTKSGRN